MFRIVILAALALACLHSVAEARPAHGRDYPGHHARVETGHTIGCSQPDMRPCGQVEHHPKANENRHKSRVLVDLNITHHKPRAWCGWWLGRHLGMPSRSLWRALAWRHVGRAAGGPAIGTIVIWSRGKGRGHVGIITGRTGHGWMVLSGNDGNAVRERVRSVSNAIAFRWP